MSIEDLRKILKDSENIVFFGGAGVSTASGIPDFRSADGLYSEKSKARYTPEEILSHTFFVRNPEMFYEFYKSKMIYRDAKPNEAHIALAKLEKQGKLKAVITQNIDGLHQVAGSKNVLELHGSVHRNKCNLCGKSFELDHIMESIGKPICDKCGGVVKPEVVLYEEMLDEEIMKASVDYIRNADVLIIGGTSLSVYPAAGLVAYYRGDKLVLINKTATSYDSRANLVLYGDIAEIFKETV